MGHPSGYTAISQVNAQVFAPALAGVFKAFSLLLCTGKRSDVRLFEENPRWDGLLCMQQK
jgi:hypothetical protein